MVRASNQGTCYSPVKIRRELGLRRRTPEGTVRAAANAAAAYLAPAAAYFLRNLSTRPAVSTIFCLPV
jgi:hypothetical protein